MTLLAGEDSGVGVKNTLDWIFEDDSGEESGVGVKNHALLSTPDWIFEDQSSEAVATWGDQEVARLLVSEMGCLSE